MDNPLLNLLALALVFFVGQAVANVAAGRPANTAANGALICFGLMIVIVLLTSDGGGCSDVGQSC